MGEIICDNCRQSISKHAKPGGECPTDAADLVNTLINKTVAWVQAAPAEQADKLADKVDAELALMAALSSTQARADKLEAELVEAKRQRDWLASEKEQAMRLKEAAESSLAAAKERVKELEGENAALRHDLERQMAIATAECQRAERARNNALEDAAKVADERSIACDEAAKKYAAERPSEPYWSGSERCAEKEATHIAISIRALKTAGKE